ncbi:hypothetical protein BSKO_12805 [Bryopsis sp. KO-2023]|nr:hypothetical protein BSKO_12805 [Bryopsis sp. KO-2023]
MLPRSRKRPLFGNDVDAVNSVGAAVGTTVEWHGDQFAPSQPYSSFDLLASLRLRAYKMQSEKIVGEPSGDQNASGVCGPVCGLVFPDEVRAPPNSRIITRSYQKKLKKERQEWVFREGTYSIALKVHACIGVPEPTSNEILGQTKRRVRVGDFQDGKNKKKIAQLKKLSSSKMSTDEVEERARKWKNLSLKEGCARCLRKDTVLDMCGGKKGPPILPLSRVDPSLGKNSSIGRLNRPGANVRHLGKAGTHQALPWAVLKMGRFAVRRSLIAEYGVYSNESIPPGELLMEYVGEVIRKEVAELREKHLYSNQGSEQGTYLFSLGPDWVIDATTAGNMARYINHSCDPNCVAELVRPCTRDSRGAAHQRRVFIYSKKDILPGEELSYDYKLSLPDATFPEGGGELGQSQGQSNALDLKLKCQCGAEACRGFL